MNATQRKPTGERAMLTTYTIFKRTDNPMGWNRYEAVQQVQGLRKAIGVLKSYRKNRLTPWTKFGMLRGTGEDAYEVARPK